MTWYLKIKMALTIGKAAYDALAENPTVRASIAMNKAADILNAAATVQEEVEKANETGQSK